MKLNTLTISYYCLAVSLYSCTTISGTQIGSIEATKMNVLYVGIKNPIEVSATGITYDKLTVEIHPGKIYPGKTKHGYVVTVYKPGHATITLWHDDGNSQKKIAKKDFRVKRVPTPRIYLHDISSGELEIRKFKKQKKFWIRNEGLDFMIYYPLKSYTLTFIKDGQKTIFQGDQQEFTSEIREKINLCEKGEVIIFSNIIVDGPEGKLELESTAFVLI